MSKAEELANKYCEGSSFIDACVEKPAYISGYRRAVSDIIIWLKENLRNYSFLDIEELEGDIDVEKVILDLKEVINY